MTFSKFGYSHFVYMCHSNNIYITPNQIFKHFNCYTFFFKVSLTFRHLGKTEAFNGYYNYNNHYLTLLQISNESEMYIYDTPFHQSLEVMRRINHHQPIIILLFSSHMHRFMTDCWNKWHYLSTSLFCYIF